MKQIRLFLLLAIALPLLSSCGYNKMVNLNEGVNAQWAQVENSYQRRADLIPNLVSTVKGYAAHESQTFEAVIEARSKATGININADNMTAEDLQRFNQAQQGLSSALSKLMVVVEAYPDLKANQNFMALQAQLEGTENRISVERQKFNTVTGEFNSYIKRFPQVIYASWFNFKSREYFKAEEGSKTAPKVEF